MKEHIAIRIILSIAIPIIVYFGIGWIAKDIYFSIWEIAGNTTIQEIYNKELLIHCCVAVGYIIISWIILDDDGIMGFMLFVGALPIAAYILCVYILPMSEGAAILNTILCIVGQILVSWAVATKDIR